MQHWTGRDYLLCRHRTLPARFISWLINAFDLDQHDDAALIFAARIANETVTLNLLGVIVSVAFGRIDPGQKIYVLNLPDLQAPTSFISEITNASEKLISQIRTRLSAVLKYFSLSGTKC
jgi:hypothetical protein